MMRELRAEERDLVDYCMEPENRKLALAIGQVQATLRGNHESHTEGNNMKGLTAEEKNFLVDYCMEPENRKLALAIGQVQATLERRIVSSFLKKLYDSVDEKIKSHDNLRWRACIPEDLEEESLKKEFAILFIMAMEDQEIEIHLGLCNFQNMRDRILYVGTQRKRENRNIPWPGDNLANFMNSLDIYSDQHRHWWFDPIDMHRSIATIEALSTLDNGPKTEYFTAKLVCLAEAISRELEE